MQINCNSFLPGTFIGKSKQSSIDFAFWKICLKNLCVHNQESYSIVLVKIPNFFFIRLGTFFHVHDLFIIESFKFKYQFYNFNLQFFLFFCVNNEYSC